MTPVAVGVDGGGTRTRAVLVDEQGDELARAEARGAVVTPSEPEAAANAVWTAVEAAMEKSGVERPAAVLWAGLSGAGSDAARAGVAEALEKTRLASRVVVGTDVEAAYHDAFGSHPGILLISGTGSIALARKDDGSFVRVGGWGQHLGDDGGGYRIGIEALRSVLRSEDGRAAPTLLRDPVLEALGMTDPRGLVPWIVDAPKGDVAALAPLVVRLAVAGDAAAAGLVSDAVAALVRHLDAIVARAGPWEEVPRLALWGGLIFGDGPLRPYVERAVSGHGLPLLDRALDPPLGAAMRALEIMLAEGGG